MGNLGSRVLHGSSGRRNDCLDSCHCQGWLRLSEPRIGRSVHGIRSSGATVGSCRIGDQVTHALEHPSHCATIGGSDRRANRSVGPENGVTFGGQWPEISAAIWASPDARRYGLAAPDNSSHNPGDELSACCLDSSGDRRPESLPVFRQQGSGPGRYQEPTPWSPDKCVPEVRPLRGELKSWDGVRLMGWSRGATERRLGEGRSCRLRPAVRSLHSGGRASVCR